MMKRHAEGRKSEKKNTLARVLITIWAVIMVICLAGAGVFVYMYHSGRGRFAERDCADRRTGRRSYRRERRNI